jgi:hypothetical protein
MMIKPGANWTPARAYLRLIGAPPYERPANDR